MRSSLPPRAVLALLLPVAASLVAGCFWQSDSGGGGPPRVELEVEPDDELLFSNILTLGRPIRGDVRTPEDVDWYQVKLTGGRTLKVDLYGTRLDQATWDAAGTVPRLTVHFPDEATNLQLQSFTAGWPYGALDFDIPAFHVPQNGQYWFVVQADTDLSPGGSYVLRVAYANPAPGQDEVEEPLALGVNDTPGTAQAIQNGLLTGHHRNGNDDFYKVQVSGPRVLRAEIVAQRNGAYSDAPAAYDPLLRILDVDGATVLAENDDAFFADSGVQELVEESGTYYVQVTQAPASTEDGTYVLHFSSSSGSSNAESEPNDTTPTADSLAYGGAVRGTIAPGEIDWYRFDGNPGDMVRLQVFDVANSTIATEAVLVTLFGPDGATTVPFHIGPEFQVMTTILQQNGPFFAQVLPGPASVAGTEYRLELNRFHSSTYETEPNDNVSAADPFPGGKFASGTISIAGDRDLWRFSTSNDELVTFVVYAGNASTGSPGSPEYSGHGSSLDPLLTIRDGVGAAVATSTSHPLGGIFTESTGDGLPTAAVTFVAPSTSHTFYLEVTDADGSGANDHTYVVERR
jgi:hypothetical protein